MGNLPILCTCIGVLYIFYIIMYPIGICVVIISIGTYVIRGEYGIKPARVRSEFVNLSGFRVFLRNKKKNIYMMNAAICSINSVHVLTYNKYTPNNIAGRCLHHKNKNSTRCELDTCKFLQILNTRLIGSHKTE